MFHSTARDGTGYYTLFIFCYCRSLWNFLILKFIHTIFIRNEKNPPVCYLLPSLSVHYYYYLSFELRMMTEIRRRVIT